MAVETVLVELNWTYGVNVNGRTEYYGPGLVPVPVDVARRKKWQPVSAVEPTGDVRVQRATAPMAADVVARAGVPHLVDVLEMAGFVTAVAIRDAAEDELTAVEGVGPKTAAKLKAAAEELLA